jgi:hypothetical protein
LRFAKRIMKASDAREHLARMDANQLRCVAEQLYKMLPRKIASEKGADLLLADPSAFQKSRSAKKAPEMPDLDLVEMETDDFWMSAYEAIQLRNPCAVKDWEKTFEKAKADRQLPHWRVP